MSGSGTPTSDAAALVRCPQRTSQNASLGHGEQQCGLLAGHAGDHTLLIPTSYPWSGAPKKKEDPRA